MQSPKSPEKVLIGMSGGLDSSLTALLLKNSGYHVVGATLKTWHESSDSRDHVIEKAQKTAGELGIEHYVIDGEQAFKNKVVDYFCHEYLSGRTPNPCNRCNPLIKWPLLLEKADELGCPTIATGHYVRKVYANNKWFIQKGVDYQKDQSYFLWNLDQTILEKAIFPLGDKTKEEVRQMAIAQGLKETARQRESMGVCFLKENDYRNFIKQWARENNIRILPGEIVDEKGAIIGKHPGLPYFTIGQKRGLGLENKHLAVARMDAASNRIMVADAASLTFSHLTLRDYHLTAPLEKNQSRKVSIRIRGFDTVPSIPGQIKVDEQGLQVEFFKKAHGLTPGQSIVFYGEDCVIGGGIF
ncbi:MAG: tRNA 2-thiouridine(34) synthase MnmA [Marinilabiliaceae bacterium]